MKLFVSLISAAALMVLAAPSSLEARPENKAKVQTTPVFPSLTRIYRFSGVVTTSLDVDTGVQASVHCTNWFRGSRSIRIVVRGVNGAVVARAGPFVLSPFQTFTYSTQFNKLFPSDSVVTPTSTLDQGSIQVDATGAEVHCTCTQEDAASASASGVFTIPPTRNFVESGTQE